MLAQERHGDWGRYVPASGAYRAPISRRDVLDRGASGGNVAAGSTFAVVRNDINGALPHYFSTVTLTVAVRQNIIHQ